MTTRSYRVDSNSVEVVPVRVTTVADPTSGDPPEFAFTQSGEPVSWVAGTWGAWTAARSEAIALTPTLPAATATTELAGGRWQVWVRFDVGGETVVESPGMVVVA
jgi:hypothetical protein